MAFCQFCAAQLPAMARVAREDECPTCHRDLHCCRQCRNFEPNAHNMCLESQAEWVAERDRRNFCDWFKLSEKPGPRRKGGKGELESRWKTMFKAPPPADEDD